LKDAIQAKVNAQQDKNLKRHAWGLKSRISGELAQAGAEVMNARFAAAEIGDKEDLEEANMELEEMPSFCSPDGKGSNYDPRPPSREPPFLAREGWASPDAPKVNMIARAGSTLSLQRGREQQQRERAAAEAQRALPSPTPLSPDAFSAKEHPALQKALYPALKLEDDFANSAFGMESMNTRWGSMAGTSTSIAGLGQLRETLREGGPNRRPLNQFEPSPTRLTIEEDIEFDEDLIS